MLFEKIIIPFTYTIKQILKSKLNNKRETTNLKIFVKSIFEQIDYFLYFNLVTLSNSLMIRHLKHDLI